MFIIKTDQAESTTGEAGPSAVVITPGTTTIEAGKTQQFSATILPASVSGDYPVSWAVSDSTLGAISSKGIYSAKAGTSGTQTVIASVSTGLTMTATVVQSIWLSSLTIGAVPSELLAGNTYNIPITYSPAGYTEPVMSSSSDSSVASLSGGGALTIYSAGTATLTLTGVNSGVTKSVTITATAEVAPEVFLANSNNLAEIAKEGENAQEEARDHLGLGKLATKDSLSAGELGAAPMATESLSADIDLNTLTKPGDYFQSVSSSATTAKHYPEAVAGAVRVVSTGVSEEACRQFYWPYNSSKEYRRFGYGSPLVFSEWSEY
ncbi:Ig-like domain-containing protein [Klebsiella pasteurii]|uniref:Ig-like domain-containing protein n=1 Tax=Klebsiella pasteurii TaxID=2587529 RepID=UPI003AB7C830